MRILDFVRPGGLVAGLLVLAITWIGLRFLRGILDRFGRRFADKRLALEQARTLIGFLLYALGGSLALLLTFHWSREMLLAVGGTIAVAFGIAFKDLAASILAGLMILMDRPFQVGDRITVGGYYGEVRRIGLRAVRLVTLDDSLVTIPNNTFLRESVASANAGALDMMVQMDFFVALDQDLDLVKEVVRDALTSSRYSYIGKPWQIVVNEVVYESYFALRLRAKAYVLDVRYEKAFETDVTERVLRGFRHYGIQPPAILEHRVFRRSDLRGGDAAALSAD